jgi:hypothetical protein
LLYVKLEIADAVTSIVHAYCMPFSLVVIVVRGRARGGKLRKIIRMSNIVGLQFDGHVHL